MVNTYLRLHPGIMIQDRREESNSEDAQEGKHVVMTFPGEQIPETTLWNRNRNAGEKSRFPETLKKMITWKFIVEAYMFLDQNSVYKNLT